MKTRAVRLWMCVGVAVVVWLVLAAPRAAVALEYDQARALAASARERARTGAVTAEDAAALARTVTECTQGPAGAPCRAILRFTSGLLAEQRAESEPARREGLLRRAIGHYEAILRETPDHTPSLQSLAAVYVKLGDAGRAEALLVDALRQHPQADGLALALGDFYRTAKRWDDALRAYVQAAAASSTAELPRRRMVECYRALLPGRLPEFRKFLSEIEVGFPSVAESGYRAIITHTLQTDRPAAEAALVRLVSVLAAARRLTPDRLDRLPAGWAPVVELKRYVETPDQVPPAPWWRGPIEHRHGLAEAALALGHQAALEGKVAETAARWEVGRRVAPDYDVYAFGPLRGFRVVRLDLQTALALHYFKFPSLDPGERKFAAVIQDLFRTKAGAYAADDLPSIQRHHTVLGTILAQKKAWNPGRVDGALFQLENALKTAAKRDGREGTYQPLPELRGLFADGLAATNEVDRARATYVEAAQAYLDTDGLRDTGRMLERARSLARDGRAPESVRIAQLETILRTRDEIAQATGSKLDPASGDYAFAANGSHGWIAGPPPSALGKDFIERQRFKVLSDLVERARTAGQPAASQEFARRAFKTAVEGVEHLTGTGDLLRLERIRARATDQKVLDFKPLTVEQARTTNVVAPKTWVLTDSAVGRAAYVHVEHDDLLAAKVVGELSRTPVADRPDFRVSRGRIVLPPDARSEAVRTRLEGLSGVGDVVVRPSLPAAVPRK